MEKVIIAVDAGGTKTKVCAITKEKEIALEVTGGPGSPAVLKYEAINNIFRLVQEVYEKVRKSYKVSYVQMGISGLGTLKNIGELEEDLKTKINVEVSMENDAILGLYSIVEDKADEGVLVLSGTGSALYGINGQETMLTGSFGHLLNETGSSYYAVKTMVLDIVNLYEKDHAYTPLGEKFMSIIGAKSINDFKVFMYSQNKDQIAEHAKFISKEAISGDIDAINILKQCGRDLAYSVSLLYKHLQLSDKTVIGFRGSFIQKAPFVKEELMDTLKNKYGHQPLMVSGVDDPIYGAYYMALKKGKI